ncbi:cytochrome b/b6 domain-containing protein [Erythrobacter sp. JK5]|uniref:cytochrome b/b6 domain-containing protein n=1 Tax=Erythrobacter sp. JK5 TaxID=2829500 RepID=UPI001BAD063F|nr:cytochrome b/b6 domain-containing protein [Erythrobacter sp. JK5]QUL38306.1 cytochrome b/b6 domain-containing protein [Erythrobacter sp. JK5]
METRPVKVWDWPVRVTHWSFAVLVPAMWITAENSQMGLHMQIGHVLLALVIFRLIWGFIGTDTARFANFVKGPRVVLAYLRGGYDHQREIGHNPLGALAVLALLGAMGAQVGMGLFAGDPFDGATGPLNPLVGVMTADWLTDTHEWFVYVVFAMIGLHLAAIGVYGVMRMQNLIGPIIVGKAEKAEGVADNSSPSLTALVIAVAVSVAIAAWIYSGAPPLS